jgi:phospholipase C
MHRTTRRFARAALAVGLTTSVVMALGASAQAEGVSRQPSTTSTPIKHLLVVFQENVSFDHYFATYPKAANLAGQPRFHAAAGTPTVNGVAGPLLHHNPNAVQPFRLDRSQAVTCDQDHDYTAEQQAFDNNLMDRFVEHTSTDTCTAPAFGRPGLVMGYYDGNTVTGLWNYAQRFAMSDNFFNTTFGPSTPGMLNLVSGQTSGAVAYDPAGHPVTDPKVAADPDAHGVGTVIHDPDPVYDDCSKPGVNHVSMGGPNIGDLLNAHHVTWGAFMGGFRPTSPATATTGAVCASVHGNIAGATVNDYIPHHAFFQYYASTANPHHLPPADLGEIGRNGRANHQYDLSDLYRSMDVGTLPAVNYVKAASYQDGHAGYSDPLDEQHFLVDLVNRVQASRYWKDTAIVIAYDDSDGWYDHAAPAIVNPSSSATNDALNGPGACGHGNPLGGALDRCGYGPRLPLLVISPYAQRNAVDHTLTDQTSVLRFIEDNWQLGRIGGGSFDAVAGELDGLFDFGRPRHEPLYLEPQSGEPVRGYDARRHVAVR